MSSTKTYKQFATDIKDKYPEYANMDDRELAERIIAKYPTYANKVTFDEAPTAVAPITSVPAGQTAVAPVQTAPVASAQQMQTAPVDPYKYLPKQENIKPDPNTGIFTPEIAAGLRGEANPNQLQSVEEGFWGTGVGDAIQGMGATTLRLLGNTADLLDRAHPVNFIREYALRNAAGAEGFKAAEAERKAKPMVGKMIAEPMINTGNEIQSRSNDYSEGKDFIELWEEGNKAKSLAVALVEGAKSLPTSIAAFSPIGLGVIGAGTFNEKYAEVSAEHDSFLTAFTSAAGTAAFELLSEKIGAGIEKGLLKSIGSTGRDAAERTIKSLFLDYIKTLPKEAITEGIEETASQMSSQFLDYMLSIEDEAINGREALLSFIYGMGGGITGGGLMGAGATAMQVPQVRAEQKFNTQLNNIVNPEVHPITFTGFDPSQVSNPVGEQTTPAENQFGQQVVEHAGTQMAAEQFTAQAQAQLPDGLLIESGEVSIEYSVDDILAMPAEAQKRALKGILQQGKLDAEQKKALLNAVAASNLARKQYEAISAALEAEIQQAIENIDRLTHPDTGEVYGTVYNDEQVYIVNTPMELGLSMSAAPTVYYQTRDGRVHPAPRDAFEGVEIVAQNAEELKQQLIDQVAADYQFAIENARTIIAEMAQQETAQAAPTTETAPVVSATTEAITPAAPEALVLGQEATTPSGGSAIILEKMTDGNYVVEETTPKGEVREAIVSADDMGAFGFPIAVAVQSESTEVAPVALATNEATETAPVALVTNETPEETQATYQFPINEKTGEPDFGKFSAEDHYQYALQTEGEAVAQQDLKDAIVAEHSKISKLKKKIEAAPFEKKAALRQQLGALKQKYDALQALKAKYIPDVQPKVVQRTETPKAVQTQGIEGIAERWNAAPKTTGMADEIVLANGETIAGQYVLVSAGAMTPSHNPNGFAPSEGFPTVEGKTVNDRDYQNDASAQTIVMQKAGQYDQRALQTPVIVSNEGIVLSGNDRTMASQIAAQNGTDKAYVEYLSKYAAKYGFTPEQVAQTPNARVVFVPDVAMPYTTSTFAKFNAEDKKTQNKTEAAVKVSKTIKETTVQKISTIIDQFEHLSDLYGSAVATNQIIGVLVTDGVVGENEVAELMDGTVFSETGKDFIETVMIGSVLKEDALRILSQMKGIRQNVVRAIIPLMNNRKLEKYNLISELNDAIKLIYQVYSETGKVPTVADIDSYILQPTLGADFGASAIDLYDVTVQVFAKTITAGQADLKKVVSLYNSQAQDFEAGQADIFSGILSKEELINETLKQSGYGQQTSNTRKQTTSSEATNVTQSPAEQQPTDETGGIDQVPDVRNELTAEEQDTQALDANIASQNPNTNPTAKQKESGNYNKARVNLQGYNITIETPKGAERSGVDNDGKAWSITMNNHYGYLDGTKGYDGDPIDVFVGPNPNGGQIFVVDQVNADGTFDESKVMLGFDTAEQAQTAYMSNYEEGWQGFGSITPAGDNFKAWLYDGKKQRKPFGEYKETPAPIQSEQTLEKAEPTQSLADLATEAVARQGAIIPQSEDGKYQIYEYKTKDKTYYAIPTADNKGLKSKGDDVADTIEEAIQIAKENRAQEVENISREKAQKAQQETEQAAAAAKKQANAGKTPAQIMQDARTNAVLERWSAAVQSRVAEGFQFVEIDVIDTAAEAKRQSHYEYLKGVAPWGNEKHPLTKEMNELAAEIKEGKRIRKKEYRLEKNGEYLVIPKTVYSHYTSALSAQPTDANRQNAALSARTEAANVNNAENSKQNTELSAQGKRIAELQSEKVSIKNKIDKLSKEVFERNGLFGDTKAEANTLFADEATIDTIDTSAKIADMQGRLATIDAEIAKLEQSAATGAQEAAGQLELDYEEQLKTLTDAFDAAQGVRARHAAAEALIRLIEQTHELAPSFVCESNADMADVYPEMSSHNKQYILEGFAAGCFFNGKLAINVAVCNNSKMLLKTLLHENIHAKIKEQYSKDQLEAIFDQIPLQEIEKYVPLADRKHKHVAADELLAYIAETLLESNSITDILSGNINNWGNISEATQKELSKLLKPNQDGRNGKVNKENPQRERRGRRPLATQSGEVEVQQVPGIVGAGAQADQQRATQRVDGSSDTKQESDRVDDERYKRAYHGSPHSFDKFSTQHMSSGEGAQAYGWGLYFTDKESIAKQYANMADRKNANTLYEIAIENGFSEMRKYDSELEDIGYSVRMNDGNLSKAIENMHINYERMPERKKESYKEFMDAFQNFVDKIGLDNLQDKIKGTRNLYTVKIHGDKTIDELNFLRWDKPASDKQIKSVSALLKKENIENDFEDVLPFIKEHFNNSGLAIYSSILNYFDSDEKSASEFLLRAGIDGIQYPTEYQNKGEHDESYNYVVFDENAIEIEESIRFKRIAAIDEQYMSAIEQGDMESAQRLVDQQAANKGYISKQDYQMSHRAPSADTTPSEQKMEDGGDFSLQEVANGYFNQPADYFSPQGARWYGYNNLSGRQSQAAINSAIRAIRAGNPATVTIYRAVPKSLKETAIRNGDWVTLSLQYAEEHGQQHMDEPHKILSMEVPASDVWWDGNDIREWGYDNGQSYAYKDTKNNRKLTDVIVRDDAGNIIPLSKRFDQRVDDVRFKRVAENLPEVKEGLVVLHNIKEEGLYNANKIGGLPMPSLAITKPSIGLSGYGNITLIGDKQLADPTDKDNKVFAADAYSPRYPELSYQIKNNKPINNFVDKLPAEFQSNASYKIAYEIEDKGLKGLKDVGYIKYQFLKEKGVDTTKVRKSRYPKATIDAIAAIPAFDYLDIRQNDEAKRQVTELWLSEDPRRQDEKYKSRFVDAEGILNDNLLRDYFNSVKQESRTKEKIDERDTLYAATMHIEQNNLGKEYDQYVQALYDQLDVEEKIYKGRTPSGKPSLIPHTLENVVKHMKSKPVAGGEGMFYGVGNARAMVTPQFKTIAQIKASQDKIVDKETFEAIKKEIDDEMSRVSKLLTPFYKYDRNQERYMGEELLQLEKAGRSESFNQLSIAAHAEVKQFATKLRNMPTEYFESKVRRGVNLSEFSGAVIPATADERVKQILESNNIPYREYSNADERIAQVQEMSEDLGVRFKVIGPRGAANLDKAENHAMRMRNLARAQEMDKGTEAAREEAFAFIPDNLKSDARLINRGEDTDGKAMRRIQANPEARVGWARYTRAVEHQAQLDKLSPTEKARMIRQLTGWEKGVDGQWRHEEPDIEVNMPALKELEKNQHLANQNVRIGNVTYRKEENGTYTLLMVKKDAKGINDIVNYSNLRESDLQVIIDNDEVFEKIKKGEGEESTIGENWDEAKYLKTDFETFISAGKRLDEVIKDKNLFAAYPQLKDIVVMVKYMPGSHAAYIRKESGQRIIQLSYVTSNTRSTLIHEIQHAIQEIEGFSSGGSVNFDTDSNAYDAYRSNSREAKAIAEALEDYKKSDEAKAIADAMLSDTVEWAKLMLERNNNSKAWKEISLARSLFVAQTGMQPAEYLDKYPTFEAYAVEQYRSLAGEVEARNVQSRANLTAEQRREKLLSETADTPVSKQIVLPANLVQYAQQVHFANQVESVAAFDFSSEDITEVKKRCQS